jgi:hypothetical protein
MSDKLATLNLVLSSISGSPTVVALEKPLAVTDCIVYSLISSVPTYSVDGSILVYKDRVQVDCWASTMVNCINLRDSVMDKLAFNNVDFTVSYLDSGRFYIDIETNLFRYSMDFFIW